MLERIFHVMVKEFTIWFRNKRMRFFLFAPPLIQIFLFGYVANMDVREIRTVFVDLDDTQQTREIRRMLEASGHFRIERVSQSAKEAALLIDRGEATCAIQIRDGFSEDLKKGRRTEIQVIIDGVDSNVALIARSYVSLILERFAYEMRSERPNVRFCSVDAQPRVWYNPDLKSRNFFLPGVIALIVTLTCLLLTSISIVWEREVGTMEQLIVTPLKPFELIVGKTVPSAIIGFFDMFLVTAFSMLFFGVPLKGGLLFLFVYTSVYILCMIGIGLFISSISQTLQQTIMATFLFFQPAILLSGFATPIESMPRVFQYVTYINPLRYYLVIVRGIFLKGSSFYDLIDEILPLFLIGVLVFCASVVRLRRRM